MGFNYRLDVAADKTAEGFAVAIQGFNNTVVGFVDACEPGLGIAVGLRNGSHVTL